MACSHFQVMNFPQPIDEVFEAFAKALPLAGMGYPIKMKDSYQLIANVPTSAWSWGEKINISMKEADNGGTSVQVKSESSFSLTLFDWGKNKKNVNQIQMHVNMILKKKG